MQYNFDEVIDRKNTNAVKLERCKALFGTDDVLPLWVADMDFRTPDFILDALRQRLEHPILGYTMPPANFYPLMQQWITAHHNWNVKREWIGFLPGIVPGLAFAVQCLTEVGDEIIVQPPVYYPFFNVVKNNNRTLVYNPLIERDGKFVMDFEDLEKKFSPKTKLFILCNPHNPGGRVWMHEELQQLVDICEKHNVTIVSDEIHADMVLPGNTRRDNAYIEMRVPGIILPLFEKYLDKTESPYLFNFHQRMTSSDSFGANVNIGIRKVCEKSLGMKHDETYCVYTFRHTWATVAQNE
jgi:cystathionine beta-lyase